jgi:L-asparaginase
MTIRIFTVGGTIDKVYFDALSDYQVGAPQIGKILSNLRIGFDYQITPLMAKDSLELTDEHRSLIREKVAACKESRILITHGTDTMVETAQRLLDIPVKTIVLTGSMLPGRFQGTDAVFNIGFATAAVQTLAPGVYICMNGVVFPAGHVRKNREEGVFEST